MNKAIDSLEKEIESVKEEVNESQDRVFEDFCRRVGVANIREYEEKQLKEAQERTERRVRLTTQQSKLENQ